MAPGFESLVAEARRRCPRVALILGSGLGHLAERVQNGYEIPFAQIPGMAVPSVEGHRGSVVLGDWAGRSAVVFSGRLHYYECHSWQRVVQSVRIAAELGAKILLITNAAGGIAAELGPGDLMVARSAIDWTRPEWWRQAEVRGEQPFSLRLIEALQDAARRIGFTIPCGVYAQVTGPSYETPAEIRALRACGADAVGMSTACEVRAGWELGLECAAISCITNKAAGLGAGPICHDEVLAVAARQREKLSALLEAFLRTVP
jgi:purine-nucleoside phosphorylase